MFVPDSALECACSLSHGTLGLHLLIGEEVIG